MNQRYRNRSWSKPPRPPKPPDIESQKLSGTVESIIFRSEDTGYTVCRVEVEGHRGPATMVGNCSAMWTGEEVTASGKWIRHKQHGYQFQADSIKCVAPTSKKGIERYLASGMIRGIGKELAHRLVKKFGTGTLDIVENHSKRLQEVEGIGPTRRQRIKESWSEQKGIHDIMIFLQGHGIGTAQSARIFRRYGDQAVAMIRENPFRLCADVWGIGFKTADGVAMSLGIPPDSEVRARAGLLHVMATFADEGHCYCPSAELLLQAEALLGISVEILGAALQAELQRGNLVKEEDRIYLRPLHEAEVSVAESVNRIVSTKSSFKPIDADRALPWAENRMKLSFAPQQAGALRMALTEKFSIMTGGPGVGKTTIIHALVDVFHVRKLRVMMAAPTGRAAKRMEEATNHEAKTIHRLLKFQPRDGRFEHDSSNPLDADVLIVDEASMIDIRLMSQFLDAVPNNACVVLVGDTDQLPSVGPGNVLRDIIHSKAVPCTTLETIFRQETGGWIVRNAHRVNNGEQLEVPAKGDDSDFYFIQAENPDDVISKMIYLVTERIPKRFGFNPMSDIQVLTPMRRNQLGAENLNAILQEALNPRGQEVERFGRKYRVRDRVMQIRNNYDKEVFNGDVGRIFKVSSEEHELVVEYDKRHVKYDLSELDELVHAYACSVHKSQGSEYPAVVLLMTTQHFKLLQRNLLYTAITRGRKLVCLVGTTKAVFIATRNNEIRQRRTGLRERLAGV